MRFLRNFLAILFCLFAFSAHAETIFLVQLGSHKSETEAETAWDILQEQYNELLSGLSHQKSEIILPPAGNRIYRLQAGPFENRNRALETCGILQESGQDCFVVETAIFTPGHTPPSYAQAAPAVAPAEPEPTPPVEMAAPLQPEEAELETLPQQTEEPIVTTAPPVETADMATVKTIDLPQTLPPAPEPTPSASPPEVTLATVENPPVQPLPPEQPVEQNAPISESPAIIPPAAPVINTVDETLPWLQEPVTFTAPVVPMPAPVLVAENLPAEQLDAVPPATTEPAAVPPPVIVAPQLPPPALQRPEVMPLPQLQVTPPAATVSPPPPHVTAPRPVPAPQTESAPVPVTIEPPVPPKTEIVPLEAKPEQPEPVKSWIIERPAPATTELIPTPPVPPIAPAPPTVAPPPPVQKSQALQAPSAEAPFTVDTGGRVEVAEAIQVPLSENEPVAPATQEAPLFTGPRPPGWGAMPSQSLLQKTLWAQLSHFDSKQEAMAYWEKLRKDHPKLTGDMRVRITQPYQKNMENSRVSLQIGPLLAMQDLEKLCNITASKDLTCLPRRDVGNSAVAAAPRYRPEERGYAARRSMLTRPQNRHSGYWVQLGSYRNQHDAVSVWDELKTRHMELSVLQPHIVQPRLSSSPERIYRLRTGPYNTRYAAQYLCDTLKSKDTRCLVVTD